MAVKVVSERPVNGRDIIDSAWNAIIRLFGEHGASQANLSLIEFNSQKNYAVLCCSHVALEMVRASNASITEIDGTPVAIHGMWVSGTLRALRRKVMGGKTAECLMLA